MYYLDFSVLPQCSFCFTSSGLFKCHAKNKSDVKVNLDQARAQVFLMSYLVAQEGVIINFAEPWTVFQNILHVRWDLNLRPALRGQDSACSIVPVSQRGDLRLYRILDSLRVTMLKSSVDSSSPGCVTQRELL